MIIAIVQARMGSTRLPGKTLLRFGKTTLLGYQLERLKESRKIQRIVVATTTDTIDNAIETEVSEHGCLTYRGSSRNVLERFYKAAEMHQASLIVRLTADDPFKCPTLIDEGISLIEGGEYDYVSNTIDTSYPEGLDFEVIKASALSFTYQHATISRHLEHVTPFIYENASKFKIGQIKSNRDLSSWRMTVDYLEDYRIMKRIAENVDKNISYEDLVEYIYEKDLREVMHPSTARNEAYNAQLCREN